MQPMPHRARARRLATAATCLALVAPMLTATAGTAQADSSTLSLSTPEMTVQVDRDFPAVERYTWTADGSTLYGRTNGSDELVVNGTRYTPTVTSTVGDEAVDYTLRVAELDLTLRARLAVSGHALTFKVTDIKEGSAHQLRTLAIPDQGLVSARSDQPGAELADARLSLTGEYNTEPDIDKHTKIADAPVASAPRGTTYAVLNTDGLAASVETNSLEDQSRLLIRTAQTGEVKTTSVSSGIWTWRPDLVSGQDAKPTELPYAKVVLTGDRNDDGAVDWQDGAMAYGEIMYRPLGADRTKNFVVSNIEYNTNSFASHPFTRVLDDIKKGSLLTDGLGQLVQLKGYQAEGHDNAHPDYGGHINEGAGGRKDLNLLVEHAKEYGAAIGVHINSTEAYPDAKSFRWDMTNGPGDTGWIYRDVSYHINRDKDVQSGAFGKRLDGLAKDVPGLSFIYNDVYFGRGYNAYELARLQHQHGWMVHTEFEDYLDRDALWYHRSGQYEGNGVRSQIIRFIQNTDRDIWYRKDATLLKGLSNLSYGGWMGQTDLNAWQRKIFTNNLPTKFMQHFPITKWTDHRVDFTDGVYSTDTSGTWQLFQGATKLAEGDTMFLPWDPRRQTKIYHWNDKGGTTTWLLPPKWRNLESVNLYRLTDTGRQDKKTLKVTDGRVTITADARTAYVLYRGQAAPQKTHWGEGAIVKDGSFNSHTLDAWSREGDARIETSDKGWQFARFDGSRAGRLTQTLHGLTPGTYAASAYVRVSGGRTATLGVSGYGGTPVDRSTHTSPAELKDPVNVWSGTRFQKIQVAFTVPRGRSTAVISLAGNAGGDGAAADFADVRVNPTWVSPESAHHYFFEDFEAADRAWGPFVNSEGSGSDNPHSHRAERHQGYTRDTISGDFSFKSFRIGPGDVWRTVPQTLEFKPGRTYRVGLKYQSDTAGQYRLQVRSGGAGEESRTLVDDALPTTTNRPLDSWPAADDPRPAGWNDSAPPQDSAPSKDYGTVFSTGGVECGDPYLALTSTGGKGAVTVDDLVVDDLGPASRSTSGCPQTGAVSLSVDDIKADAGGDVPIAATFTNHADVPATDVAVELAAPSGFTLRPTSPTIMKTVAPGETLKVSYTLRAPAEAKPGSYHVSGEATSSYGGQRVTALADQRLTFHCRAGVRCEAEDAVLGGGATMESLARGQSGDSYVNYPSGSGGFIEWPVNVDEPGDYTLTVHYALQSGDRPLTLSVNGQKIRTDSYPITGSWSQWSDAQAPVTLKAGTNTVRLTSAKDDGPNIDYLTVTASDTSTRG